MQRCPNCSGVIADYYDACSLCGHIIEPIDEYLTEDVLMSNLPNRKQLEQGIYERNFRDTIEAQEAEPMLNAFGKATTPSLIEIVRESGYHYLAIDAIETLVTKRDQLAVPVLIEILEDSESFIWDEIPASAAWALGKLQASEAVSVLIKFAKETTKDNRAAAIEALGNIGDPRAIPALEDFRSDKTVLNRREYETYWLYRRYRGKRISDIAVISLWQIEQKNVYLGD